MAGVMKIEEVEEGRKNECEKGWEKRKKGKGKWEVERELKKTGRR